MQIKVLFFGQLLDITGTKELIVEEIVDTSTLLIFLCQEFPLLAKSKYVIAVDREMISGNRKLESHNIVALMPPFSGG